jgi:hypothetical protein
MKGIAPNIEWPNFEGIRVLVYSWMSAVTRTLLARIIDAW